MTTYMYHGAHKIVTDGYNTTVAMNTSAATVELAETE